MPRITDLFKRKRRNVEENFSVSEPSGGVARLSQDLTDEEKKVIPKTRQHLYKVCLEIMQTEVNFRQDLRAISEIQPEDQKQRDRYKLLATPIEDLIGKTHFLIGSTQETKLDKIKDVAKPITESPEIVILDICKELNRILDEEAEIFERAIENQEELEQLYLATLKSLKTKYPDKYKTIQEGDSPTAKPYQRILGPIER